MLSWAEASTERWTQAPEWPFSLTGPHKENRPVPKNRPAEPFDAQRAIVGWMIYIRTSTDSEHELQLGTKHPLVALVAGGPTGVGGICSEDVHVVGKVDAPVNGELHVVVDEVVGTERDDGGVSIFSTDVEDVARTAVGVAFFVAESSHSSLSE